jgi:hypothetical protein
VGGRGKQRSKEQDRGDDHGDDLLENSIIASNAQTAMARGILTADRL